MQSVSRSLRPMGQKLGIWVWKNYFQICIHIHFYNYSSLFLWFKSKFSNFGIKSLSWQNTCVPSRSIGDICKCKQLFWTIHNSFFHTFNIWRIIISNKSARQLIHPVHEMHVVYGFWSTHFLKDKSISKQFPFHTTYNVSFIKLINVLGSSSIWTHWILNICCCFLQAGAVEKIKTNIQNSNFKFRQDKWMS